MISISPANAGYIQSKNMYIQNTLELEEKEKTRNSNNQGKKPLRSQETHAPIGTLAVGSLRNAASPSFE